MLTSKERFKRMYEHREADRVPIIDSPWAGTVRRWVHEGMPEGADWRDFFGVDKVAGISVDITPRYSHGGLGGGNELIEEDEKSQTFYTDWGVKLRYNRGEDSTPEFLDYKVVDQAAWDDCKRRMYEGEGRIDWDYLKENYPRWPDDMGYKGTTFFSNEMYRALLAPAHKRAIDWAHERGIVAELHSCGNIMSRVDDLVEMGLDSLNPLEVKAGMQPEALKAKYGANLVLHGGINAVLWNDKDAILEEIHRVVPVLKENGGYIFSSDHSIPNSVSLDNFRAIVEEVKRVGAYA